MFVYMEQSEDNISSRDLFLLLWYLDKKKTKKYKFILTYNNWIQYFLLGKSRHLELDAIGPILSIVKWSIIMNADIQSLLIFYSIELFLDNDTTHIYGDNFYLK